MSKLALPISPLGKFDFGVVSSEIDIKMLNLILVNLQFLWWKTIKSNFNGSNISGTTKISSRQELMSFNHSTRSGGKIGISFSIFFSMRVYCAFK